MELGPLITLAVIYGVMSLIGKMSKGASGGQGQQQGQPPRQRVRTTTVARPRKTPATFEDLLAEMRAQIEQAARVEPPAEERVQDPPVAVARRSDDIEEVGYFEEIEDRRSLEIEQLPVSIESVPRREEVRIISLDDESQRIAEARRQSVAQRNRGWRLSDHREFHDLVDRRPETAAADATAVRRRNELRRAMIWREILDRPVSLRQD